MTRRDDSTDDDEDFDPEGPDPVEMDSSDDPDLDVCPRCRKMISEEAERCPHCGEYISAEDAPLSGSAWIMIAVIVLLLLAGVAAMF
jgi:RNA polymerase subunit RPABC4/transcription elongation factor Spt4